MKRDFRKVYFDKEQDRINFANSLSTSFHNYGINKNFKNNKIDDYGKVKSRNYNENKNTKLSLSNYNQLSEREEGYEKLILNKNFVNTDYNLQSKNFKGLDKSVENFKNLIKKMENNYNIFNENYVNKK